MLLLDVTASNDTKGAKVVHRDIKSCNLAFAADGTLKIIGEGEEWRYSFALSVIIPLVSSRFKWVMLMEPSEDGVHDPQPVCVAPMRNCLRSYWNQPVDFDA